MYTENIICHSNQQVECYRQNIHHLRLHHCSAMRLILYRPTKGERLIDLGTVVKVCSLCQKLRIAVVFDDVENKTCLHRCFDPGGHLALQSHVLTTRPLRSMHAVCAMMTL